jgi:ketosteroid isomerase-like protein
MSQENVEAVLRSYETFNEYGVEATAAAGWWHEDIEWHDPPEFPDAGIHRGIEAAKAALQGYVDVGGHMKIHVDECIDAGDEVFVRWQARVRGASSGAPAEGSMYHVFTVKDGKLVRLRQYLDRDAALVAAGLAE